MHNFVKLRHLNHVYHILSSWISNKHSWTMKIKNFSLLNFSKTTDLSFLASAQIPTFCRESTKINQKRTKGKGMPILHVAYIKSSTRLVRWSYVTFASLSLFMQTKHYQSSIKNVNIGHSMICSDIWHKYHAWYFEIVTRNFTSS